MALELNYPAWLDKLFFEKSIGDNGHNQDVKVKVLNFTVKGATNKGDNYLSDMFRAKVEYKTAPNGPLKTISLIVKAVPTDNLSAQLGVELNAFPKEISMYTVVLPRMQRLLGAAGIPSELCAKAFHSSKVPPTFLVMEDLATRGYRMTERTDGLNFKHCQLALEKLALLHASSMALAKQDPTYLAEFKYGIFNPTNEADNVTPVFTSGLEHLTEAAFGWPGCEKYAKKLEAMKSTMVNKVLELTSVPGTKFNVLNHGDFWINNFLFKYASGSKELPTEVLFVDYQLSVWQSPGIDLNYFMCTSPSTQVRSSQRSELLLCYHNALARTLNALHYSPVPTLADVHTEFNSMEYYGLVAAIGILPLVVQDSLGKDSDTNETEQNVLGQGEEADQLKRLVYRCKTYELAMREMLPYFDSKGVI